MDLKDRVAVVTGAGSGIGRAIALTLAGRGARVAALDIDAVSAKETAALVATRGGRAESVQADTSVAADVDRAVSAAVAALGPLDIMVNMLPLCCFLPGHARNFRFNRRGGRR